MILTIKDTKGNPAGELQVSFPVIENGRGTQAVHDTVVAFLANQRRGTACTKTMGEVAGSGKKPWRQKGTGRARSGSFQSPVWVGGGVTFGPKPRDFGKKVSQSTKTLALRKALTARLLAGDVVLVDHIHMNAPKTKQFAEIVRSLELKGSVLFITEATDRNLLLACRNIEEVDLATAKELNTYQVLRYNKLVFTRAAFEVVENRLK